MEKTKNEQDDNFFVNFEKENTVDAEKEVIKFFNSESKVRVICSETKNGTKSKGLSIQWVATFASMYVC